MSGLTKAKYIVEAALFSAGRSISVQEISEATGLDRRTVRKAARELVAEYGGRDTSLTVTENADSFALEVRSGYAKYTMKLAEQEIPRMALKTLAIIAFHQPLKQSRLKLMIGSRAYDDVKILKEMGLITSRPDGRTYSLRTSSRFPDYFGIDPDPTAIKRHLAGLVGVDLDRVIDTADEADEGSGDTDAGALEDGEVDATVEAEHTGEDETPDDDPVEDDAASEAMTGDGGPKDGSVHTGTSSETASDGEGNAVEDGPVDDDAAGREPSDGGTDTGGNVSDEGSGSEATTKTGSIEDVLHDDGGD